MKKRLTKFAGFVLSIAVVCAVVVVYVELQSIQANRLQSEAIIAQAQASIIQARAQLVVNQAVAFQLYTNSLLLVALSIVPTLVFAVLFLVLVCREFKK